MNEVKKEEKELKTTVADAEMLKKAKDFLHETGMFHEWCKLESREFFRWLGKAQWLHSDRWSAAYDWVHSGRFKGIELPEGIETCLVEYWETNALHLKTEPPKEAISCAGCSKDTLVIGEYVLTPCKNAFNNKYSYWLSKKGMTGAMYCFSLMSSGLAVEKEYKYQVENIQGYINAYQKKFECC